MEYAIDSEIVKIRLMNEEWITSAGHWAFDGMDAQGRYTEWLFGYPTESECMEAILAYQAEHNLEHLPIVKSSYIF